MTALEQFVKRHFLSEKREKCLLDFLKTNDLVDFTELIIEQISRENLPDLPVTARRLYMTYKKKLMSLAKDEGYQDLEGLVIEFSWRLIGTYYLNSNLSVSEFIVALKDSVSEGAQSLGVDPVTVDYDLDWQRMAESLKGVRGENLEKVVIPDDEPYGVGFFVPDEESDFTSLYRDLTVSFDVFKCVEDIELLLGRAETRVVVNDKHLQMVVYLFRQLCPITENEDLLEGRYVNTSPKKQLWKILASKIEKPDGRTWSAKTLKNYCSQVNREDKYSTIRADVQTIIERLDKGNTV